MRSNDEKLRAPMERKCTDREEERRRRITKGREEKKLYKG